MVTTPSKKSSSKGGNLKSMYLTVVDRYESKKNEVLKNLAQLKGSSKRNTSDAQLHDARDKAFGLGMSKNNRVLTTDASEMRCTKAISVNLTQA